MKIASPKLKKEDVNSFTLVFCLFAFGIFTLLQFLKSDDIESMIAVDFRMIFAGCIYCIVAVMCFTRMATVPVGILMLSAGGFLLYSYFNFFNFGRFSVDNMNPYMIAFAFLSGIGIIFGVRLYQRNDGLDRMGANLLISLSVVFLILIVSDYVLPKPIKIDVSGVWVTVIVAFFIIAGSIAAQAFTDRDIKKRFIPIIIYRFVSIGSIFLLILTLNNVIYNGCYPLTPIGCPCNLQKVEIPQIIPAPQPLPPSVSHTVSNTIFTPKGGSLCGTLGMTGDEAFQFAKDNGLKYWWKKGVLYVLIFPGDQFHKVDGKWEFVEH